MDTIYQLFLNMKGFSDERLRAVKESLRKFVIEMF